MKEEITNGKENNKLNLVNRIIDNKLFLVAIVLIILGLAYLILKPAITGFVVREGSPFDKIWNGTFDTSDKVNLGVWNVSTKATAEWFYETDLINTRNFTLNFTQKQWNASFDTTGKTTGLWNISTYAVADFFFRTQLDNVRNLTLNAAQGGADTTFPVVNTTFNKSLSNILNGDVINLTANITDNVGLSFCQIIINQSGPTAIQIINISLSGTSGQCSNSSPVTLASGNVINYTIRVNDTANNFKTNDTIVTVASSDTTSPGVNITNINGTADIRINDVLNISCQSFDSPTVGNITFNLTGSLDLYNFSFSLSGASANYSQNITVNVTRSNVINATCWAYDSSGNGAQNSTLITVANTPPPQVALIAPKTNNQTINRTPTFIWNNVSDADNDSLLFNIKIVCVQCSSDNRDVNTTNLNFTPTNELQFLGDENYFYNWSVRAIDNYTSTSETSFGNFSNISNITINSYVSLSLLTSTVNFGTLELGNNSNTTDDTPAPLVLDNDGNVFENVSVYAEDDLWESAANPTNKFQFKIANVTAELFSFNWTASTTGFTNLPTAAAVAVVDLNYSDAADSAEVDIHIEVPTDEPSGAKQSKIVFEAKRSK